MNVILRTLALVWKELLAVLKDPRSRVSLIGPPLLQVLLFGYAATYDLRNVPYAVVDQDQSQMSRAFLAHLDGSGAFHRVANVPNADRIWPLINNRTALLVIEIPRDFERRLTHGQAAPIQALVDGRNSNTAASALFYLNQIATTFNQSYRATGDDAPPPGVRVVTRAWFNPNLITRWQVVPALLALITLLDVMILTSLSVAREREQGTLYQLLVTPLRPLEVMIGKGVPSVFIGLAQSTVLLLAAVLWFHIPFAGNYFTLYLALTLFLTASVAVGLLISSLSATMQQAMLGAFVVLMPFALLSGLMTPLSSMPVWVQRLDMANPLMWAIIIVQRMFLEGATLGQVFPLMVPLIVLAVLAIAAASFAFRHRLA